MPDTPKSENPAVIEEVKSDLKALGDNNKEQWEKLNKAWEDYKKVHQDAIKEGKEETGEVKTKLDKFATEILQRIEDGQKANTERMDKIETTANRNVQGVGPEDGKDYKKEAMELKKLYNTRNGLTNNDTEIEAVSVEEYKAYLKNLDKYCRKGEKLLNYDEIKALSVGSDPDGGYFVTPQMSQKINTMVYESSPMRSLASVERVSGTELKMYVDVDEAGAGWTSEEGTVTTTDTPEAGLKTIVVHEMYAAPKATNQILEDANINVEAWLAGKVGEKMARLEATAFISGTGVGQPRGILSQTMVAAASWAWGSVGYIHTGATTAGAVYEGLVNIIMGLKERYHPNASWLMRRASLGTLLGTLADGDDSYLFAPSLLAGGQGGGFSATILGYPVRMAADMPAIAENAYAMALGDWSYAYQIVDRLGITVQRDPFTKKPFVEFYSRKRVGGDVVNYEAYIVGKCAV